MQKNCIHHDFFTVGTDFCTIVTNICTIVIDFCTVVLTDFSLLLQIFDLMSGHYLSVYVLYQRYECSAEFVNYFKTHSNSRSII